MMVRHPSLRTRDSRSKGESAVSYLVSGMGVMTLAVPDLDRSVDEATNVLGLRLVHQADGMAVLTSNERRAELVYRAQPGEAGGVLSVGLEAYTKDAVQAAAGRAEAAGWRILSHTPSLEVIEASVTMVSDEGLVFEIHTPVPLDQPIRYATAGVAPRKLDHVGPKTTDTARLAAQLTAIMGLQVSDRTEAGELCFMRAGNRQHHTCSLIQDVRPGLHHYAWAFWRFTDFLALGDTLDVAGQKLMFGPGRHGAGDNIYTYHVDRGGILVECCTEMEVIENDTGFQARTWSIDNPDLINRWGVMPPPEWLSHSSTFCRQRANLIG